MLRRLLQLPVLALVLALLGATPSGADAAT